MNEIPDIPFHKKLTTPPLMMKSFTMDQLLGTVVAMLVFMALGWLLAGFIGCVALGATTFFGLKTWFSYMNTRLPPGYLTHRVLSFFAQRNFSPGVSPWMPTSADIPTSLKEINR